MKVQDLLERVASEDFEAELVASTPAVLRKLLMRRSEIEALRRCYDDGSLSDDGIRDFVNQLLADGGGEEPFPYQVALAAIAVMLEERFSLFAEEYVRDLARVRSSSFALASGVAKESAAARHCRSGTSYRLFRVGSIESTSTASDGRFQVGRVESTSTWSSTSVPDNGRRSVLA